MGSHPLSKGYEGESQGVDEEWASGGIGRREGKETKHRELEERK